MINIKKLFLCAAAIITASAALCTASGAAGSYEAQVLDIVYQSGKAAKKQPVYTKKLLDVSYYPDEDVFSDRAYFRFYNNKPNVPYIGIKMFYDLMSYNGMRIKSKGNDKYLITTGTGDKAVADVKNGTLTVYDYENFTDTYEHEKNALPTFLVEDDIIYSVDKVTGRQAPEKTVFDFKKYDIGMYAASGDIWLPLATVSDLFSYGCPLRMVYDGREILVISRLDIEECTMNDDYFDRLYENYFPEDNRPDDVTAFSYSELCFVFDNLYGSPQRNVWSEKMKEKGLDRFLSENSTYSAVIKKLLTDNDIFCYQVGLAMLDSYIYDGGHTNLHYYLNYMYDDREEVNDLIRKYSDSGICESDEDYKINEYLTALRNKKLSGKSYRKYGDTVIYSFDEFEFDFTDWYEYSENGGSFPDDTVGSFITAMKKAEEDDGVEYFVIDLTCNGGGDVDAAAVIASFVTGYNEYFLYYNGSERELISEYSVDRNLDGAIDSKDKAVKSPLKFAVLTSCQTFSSANWLVYALSDSGVPVIGERSGGGGCSVEEYFTPDGIPYTISSLTEITGRGGADIDTGTEPYRSLVNTREDGTVNRSGLYNVNKIKKYVKEYYAGA